MADGLPYFTGMLWGAEEHVGVSASQPWHLLASLALLCIHSHRGSVIQLLGNSEKISLLFVMVTVGHQMPGLVSLLSSHPGTEGKLASLGTKKPAAGDMGSCTRCQRHVLRLFCMCGCIGF